MKTFALTKNSVLNIIFLMIISICTFGQSGNNILQIGEFAPDFKVKDILGKSHSINLYKGKKILLSFYRNAGCPVCNYRFHELEDEKAYFQKNNIVLIAVYESSAENLKKLVDTNQFFQFIVSDEEGILYKNYGVEANRSKLIKGVFHGANQKAYKGKQRMPKGIKQDGNPNRIAADFLINESGNVEIAYYGTYLGDRLPIEMIKEKLEK